MATPDEMRLQDPSPAEVGLMEAITRQGCSLVAVRGSAEGWSVVLAKVESDGSSRSWVGRGDSREAAIIDARHNMKAV